MFFSFFISILFTYSYIDFSSNMSVGVGHVYTAKSLALSGDFNVDEYWGNSGVDVITAFDGHKYVAYAPLNAVLMAIPYYGLQFFYFFYSKLVGPINGDISIILESLAFSLPSSIFYSLAGFLLFRFLMESGIKKMIAILTVIGFLFGTIFLNYSVSFFNHVPAAFFIFYSYCLISKPKTDKAFLFAGILTGLAFLTEFPTILFSVAVGLFLLYELKYEKLNVDIFLKRLSYFSIPIVFSIFLLGLYNYVHFGSPFLMAEQILYQQKLALGVGVEHGFSQNPVYGIWGLYFSPLKGLFLISPFLLFSFLGFRNYLKQNKKLAILGLSYIVFVSLLYSLWPDCFGATPFGPRYLISVIPFLAFYSGFALKSKLNICIYSILITFGVFICVMNLLDGLPSGRWFSPTNCNSMQYGSFFKANSYLMNLIKGDFRFASILLKG